MSDLPEPLFEEAHGQLSLAELVNRVLDRGAVISGEVVISVAGIDLVYLGLNVVVASFEAVARRPAGSTSN